MIRHTIYFTYNATGNRDKVTFAMHPEFMEAYNSLKNYCQDFLTITTIKTERI
jgi:hypothetical protein